MYPVITLPSYLEKTMDDLTEINIKEWKEKYPTRVAAVIESNDGIHAKILVQSPRITKEKFRSTLLSQYSKEDMKKINII